MRVRVVVAVVVVVVGVVIGVVVGDSGRPEPLIMATMPPSRIDRP